MSVGSDKNLWIQIRFISSKLRQHNNAPPDETLDNKVVTCQTDACVDGSLVCLSISSLATSDELRGEILEHLKLDPTRDVVFKLRNASGQLVPLSNRLESNEPTSPFVLEVVDVHQNVKARHSSLSSLEGKFMENRIQMLDYRVGDLERQMSVLGVTPVTSLEHSDLDVATELQLLVTQVALLKQEIEGDLLVNAAAASAAPAATPTQAIDSYVSIIN